MVEQKRHKPARTHRWALTRVCVRLSVHWSVRPSVGQSVTHFFEFAKSLISDLKDGYKVERRHTHAHTHTDTHTHMYIHTHKRATEINELAVPQ